MSSFLDNLPGQLPNPFSGGKIIGVGVSHDEYAKQPNGVKRGDPAYIMSRGSLMEFSACPHKWIAGRAREGFCGHEVGQFIGLPSFDAFAVFREVCGHACDLQE